MIADITINRKLVFPNSISINENGTIAVNQGSSVLCLEPKLPNFLQTLDQSNEPILVSKNLYTQQLIIDNEMLDRWDIRKFNRVVVVDPLDEYHFSRVDPVIVKYVWSRSSLVDKTCKLFVLFNTGELVVVQNGKETGLFDNLIRGLGVNVDNYEIPLTNHQFKSCKIKDFAIIDNSLTILNDLHELRSFDYVENKWVFEKLTHLEHNILSLNVTENYFVYITTSNEVIVDDGNFTTIYPAGRFKVSCLKCVDRKIYMAISKQLIIYDTVSKSLITIELPFLSMVNSIAVINDFVIVGHETGLFSPSIDVQRALNRFIRIRKLQHDGEVFIHGIEGYHGILVVVYKMLNKDNFNFSLLSKQLYHIGFIELVYTSNVMDFPTPLSFVNLLWFKKYSGFHFFTKSVVITDASIEKFVDSLKSLKVDLGLDKFDTLPVPSVVGDLKSTLVAHFTQNPKIKLYQAIYNLNEVYIRLLQVLVPELEQLGISKEACSDVESYQTKVLEEQSSLESIIHTFMLKLILSVDVPIKSDIDQFIIEQYRLYLNMEHSSSTITLNTPYLSETFTTDTNFDSLAMSHTHHSWTRCKLTLLPIIDVESNWDQFRKFHYSVGGEGLAGELANCLGYCVITGNCLLK